MDLFKFTKLDFIEIIIAMKLIVLFLSSAIISIAAESQVLSLSSDLKSVTYGQQVVLKWKIPNGATAYVTTIGLVKASGERPIIPESTSTYTIVCKQDGQLKMDSISIAVEGLKGQGGLTKPNIEDFKYGQTFLVVGELVPLLGKISSSLQDSLHYVCSEFVTGGTHCFVTNLSARNYLIGVEESSKLKSKRVAYLIEVNANVSKDPRCNITVKVIIEYVRRGEETWRRDSSEKLYWEVIAHLKKLIVQ